MLEENGHFDSADIYIDPPLDGNESEEDSGDEEHSNETMDNLSGRQLQAVAGVQLRRGDETVEVRQMCLL